MDNLKMKEVHLDALANRTTRCLLKYLQAFRKASGKNCEYCNQEDCTTCKQVRVPFDFTEAEIRYVLAKRPHIPNKIEAKRIRQERAKQR